ncbi:hypothetical protein RQM59_06020 [Flavobacteriaceae bacterium S356]|uniref:Uncharacterized protein n=1 Tax=Asprobacillus argus TaxID=3076534 RepID=A0ABU3LET2_9FLAO|nr:hypothetical protein [Flavobacteriaceae bacterium S356]
MKRKLVVILPRGEAIKNFVYSGISDALKEEYELVFFSVIPNAEIKTYLKGKCDYLYELDSESKDKKYASEVKKCIQIAHAKNLNSVTGNLKLLKDDVDSKKNFLSSLLRKIRKKIAYNYASDKKLKNLTSYYVRLQYKKNKVKYFEKLLNEIQPNLVFNGSHIHNYFSLDLLYACKKLNIKTAAFLFSWDNLTSQGRIIPTYDYYFTWNEKIKGDLLKYYPFLSNDVVFVTGSPQFDFHFIDDFIYTKEELYDLLEIKYDKKIILYSTGMAYYTPKEDIIVSELHERLKKIDPNLQLVVRIYAKDDNSVYYALRDQDSSLKIPDHYWELNHLTPTLKDIKLFTSLVKYSSIGINVASTVSLDLAIHNIPVLNIAFNPPNVDVYPNDYRKIYDFDHYKPIVASGAVSLVYDLDDFEEQVKAYMKDPHKDEEARKKLIHDFFGQSLEKDKKTVFLEVFNTIFRK